MSKRSGVLVAAAIIALTVLTGTYSYNSRSVPSDSLGCSAPRGDILIIAGPSGFNDSVGHARPWPIVTVQKGDTVHLFVCNKDPVSAHGFAIDHYLNSGMAIRPESNFRVSFVADQGGNFIIYCNIFCPVHPFMIGRLIVKP